MAGLRAYSYQRFSTPEQIKGDSLRRQVDLAQEYVDKHGLILDDKLVLQDLGVSAFRGTNKTLGRLGYFMEAVRAGEVPPGSLLLVESLDRLSRDDSFEAQGLLLDMVRSGVGIVTLVDQRLYSKETLKADPMGLIYAVLSSSRSHEESALKSRRITESWIAKRAAAVEGKPLTGLSPAWVTVDLKAGTIELIPERAAIVRRIYAMTLEGVGQHAIAQAFNRERLSPWGRAKHWQRSYIAKILASPTVVGTLTPHRMDFDNDVRTRVPLEPIENYFPAAISPEVFADVQALGASKRGPGRGASAGSPVSNVLAGLAKCPSCSSTMTRVAKGPRSRPMLVCVRAKAGAGCSYHSVPYAHVEGAILDRLAHHLGEVPAGGDGGDDLEAAIFQAEAERDDLREQAEFLLDNLSRERSPAIASRLRHVENQLDDAAAAVARLVERRDAISGLLIAARVARAVALLKPELPDGGPDLAETIDRAALNAALRGLFKRAVVNWINGTIDFEWTHGGETKLHYAMSTIGVDVHP